MADQRRRDLPPFSNGTEYELWQYDWCRTCIHEHREFDGPCDDFAVPAIVEERVPDILVELDGLWFCKKYVGKAAE